MAAACAAKGAAAVRHAPRRISPSSLFRSRDMLFGGFMIMSYVLYLFKAVPELCSIGPPGYERTNATTEEAPPVDTTNWPFSWQLVCGKLTMDSISVKSNTLHIHSILSPLLKATAHCNSQITGNGPAGLLVTVACGWAQASYQLASKVSHLVLLCLQGIATFVGLGWLHDDLAQIAVTPLRVVAWCLLLLPLPRLNISSSPQHAASSSSSRSLVTWRAPLVSHWHQPLLRHVLVIVFRVAPAVAAAYSVGRVSPRYFNQSCLSYYPGMALYMYVGWTAWVLLLPFKLQMVISCCEWLLSYSTTLRVASTYSHLLAEAGRGGFNPVVHFFASAFFIMVLPGVCVKWLERQHKSRTAAGCDSAAGNGDCCSTAAHGACTGADAGPSTATGCVTGNTVKAAESSTHAEKHISSSHQQGEPVVEYMSAPPLSEQEFDSSRTIRRGSQLMSDIASSLQLAAAAPKAVPYSQATYARTALPGYGVNVHGAALPDIMPSLRGLVGAENAAAVFAAAAAQADAGHRYNPGPAYKPLAAKLPVGVKVHNAPHSAVLALTPVLTAAVVGQHATVVSGIHPPAPAYTYSACFSGCVQLLASVYRLRGTAGDTGHGGSDDLSGHGGDDPNSSDLQTASALVADRLLGKVCHQLGGVTIGSEAHVDYASHVDVCVGGATASRLPLHKQTATAVATARGGQPSAVGSALAAEAATAAAGAARVTLSECEPACLVSCQQQKLSLHLSGHVPSSTCRLLLFQHDGVVLDEQLSLDLTHSNDAIISVDVPALTTGVVHVAALAGPKPTELAAGEMSSSGTTHHSKPLLLQPLLVLPEPAATELQLMCHTAASATADLDGDAINQIDKASAWSVISELALDVAYVLAAANDPAMKAAATTASSAAVLAPAVSSVLAHVCIFLSSQQCWNTLDFLVKHMAQAVLPQTQQDQVAAEAEPSQLPTTAATESAATCSSAAAGSSGQEIRPTEYEPDTKPSMSKEGSEAKVSELSGLHDPDALAAPVVALTALAVVSTEQDTSWKVVARQLMHGFKNPQLETQYLDDITAQTFVADLFSTVYAFFVAVSADVLTDQLRAEWSAGAWGLVAWEVFSRFINFMGLVVPNCLLLLYRHRLAKGGRREWAVVWCERCLAVVPLCTGLGLLRINASAVEILANPHMLLTVMLWVSGAIKAAARQVRVRKLTPTLLVELTGAVALSLPLGLSLRASLFRYAGTTLAAISTATLLELRSRRGFISRMSKQVHAKAE